MSLATSNAAPSHATDQTRIAGFILLVVTLLAVAFMAHHPTVGRTPDIGHAIERIADLSHASAIVHGVLIAAMLVVLYCLTVFASRRGTERAAIRGGTIAYAMGVVIMIGAALVSGFVITEVAKAMPHDTQVDLQIARQLLILCGILNQACANCATVLMSVGIALWSLDLLMGKGIDRALGALGCVAGVLPVVALWSGAIHLDVHGMLSVVLLQAVWQLAVAAWLIRAGRRVQTG